MTGHISNFKCFVHQLDAGVLPYIHRFYLSLAAPFLAVPTFLFESVQALQKLLLERSTR